MSFKSAITKNLVLSLIASSYSLALANNTGITTKQAVIPQYPPPIGFYTPNLGAPGPLIAFGENILPKGQVKISMFWDNYGGQGMQFVDLSPEIIYGITDRLSVLLNTPYAANYKFQGSSANGPEDTVTQFEYAYYVNSTASYQEQATMVANFTIPTGSANADPPTGAGSPSYFIGATYNRTYVDWLFFVSPGATFTTPHHSTKFGNKFLYQWGLGRNITEIHSKWILAWVAEFDGQYTQAMKNNGVRVSNTGSNVIFLTPSLSLSGESLSLQAGLGVPIVANMYGSQPKTNYLLAASIGWTL